MSLGLPIALGTLFVSLCVFGALVAFEPEWLAARLRERTPSVVYAVDTQKPIVALTIDDGPDPIETPKILDLLRQYDARATFFLITDRVPGNEAIVEQIVAEGHELANHLTEDHPSIRLPLDEFERQLIEADGILSEFADVEWFRPGSGWYNEGMLAVVDKHGYSTALGSVYPFDPQLGSAWFTANYVLWKIHPGAIIVLHDYGVRGARTAIALETILPELTLRGYKVVSLSELTDQ
jgi:peptidoglycan/xylan/chitin deacetylase (PgdA/CDA1 family)